jgi:hypothetical protein
MNMHKVQPSPGVMMTRNNVMKVIVTFVWAPLVFMIPLALLYDAQSEIQKCEHSSSFSGFFSPCWIAELVAEVNSWGALM